ncbi:hypothetical protein PHSY_003502 [Pseudozyma hubeiensis SY62]|uniref:Uncharacterized protein n=1 Tax=Pseudozyma hubeiensis (strain SY62) TaxID=1305764 RepID=R9P3R0_PSEHS|nr:hypothetical protein PHSY_003502 [Pseudozyma hubeiensis SY62]GAC95924.1 hypothetical protein PHSY_003502 [Pseudozyma hubeiensis SY62]
MSSVSSRFSSVASLSTNTHHPPKPTYNSPKLVKEPVRASSPSQDYSRVVHPFASSSFASSRRAPAPPQQYVSTPDHLPQDHEQTRTRCISEFDSMQNSFPRAASTHIQNSVEPSDLAYAHQRQRSNTLGSQMPISPDFGPSDDLLRSQPQFKSQFDDSDDEERLEAANLSFSSVSTRARLAAIGTATRLFKQRRHSRTPSNSINMKSSEQHVSDFIQAGKRTSEQQNAASGHLSASDSLSPLPRRAVFGHRPSPSDLCLHSSVGKYRAAEEADRDLILGLQGGASRRRSKQSDKKKTTLKQSEQRPHTSHAGHNSVNVTTSRIDSRHHFNDPPPYCAPADAVSIKGEVLRKSQSLSTLRFDMSRRPSNTSVSPKSTCQPVPEHPITTDQHAVQTAWEAMYSPPPSTVSDHASTSSYGRITRSHGIAESPPRKAFIKAHCLPPQKPPPKSDLPPPPPLKDSDSETSVQPSDADRSSVEASPSSPSSASDSSCEARRNSAVLTNVYSKSGSASRPQTSEPDVTLRRALPPQHQSQVVLDIGGTTLVTLVSTLQGAHGDEPRLLELLQSSNTDPNELDTELSLCKNTQLTRRKRVDTSTRKALHERSDSDQSAPIIENSDSHPDVVATKVSAMDANGTTSRTSPSTSTSCPTDSDVSTSRTSELSAASSRSEHNSVVIQGHEQALRLNTAPSRAPTPSTKSHTTPPPPLHVFLDRNGDLYRDILDILRSHKLPYRLQASSVSSIRSDALELQLRCRLHEVMDEADWLGYRSIVELCKLEIGLL